MREWEEEEEKKEKDENGNVWEINPTMGFSNMRHWEMRRGEKKTKHSAINNVSSPCVM